MNELTEIYEQLSKLPRKVDGFGSDKYSKLLFKLRAVVDKLVAEYANRYEEIEVASLKPGELFKLNLKEPSFCLLMNKEDVSCVLDKMRYYVRLEREFAGSIQSIDAATNILVLKQGIDDD